MLKEKKKTTTQSAHTQTHTNWNSNYHRICCCRQSFCYFLPRFKYMHILITVRENVFKWKKERERKIWTIGKVCALDVHSLDKSGRVIQSEWKQKITFRSLDVLQCSFETVFWIWTESNILTNRPNFARFLQIWKSPKFPENLSDRG